MPLTNGSNDQIHCRPFLRWAGGKQKLLRHLLPFMPSGTEYRTYFEPFMGAGALFFAAAPQKAVLGDINGELMICYEEIRRDPVAVARQIRMLAKQDSREFFYKVRRLVPEKLTPVKRAARFVYLNKAAFNGIYRVNGAGQFNVPYGPSFRGPAIPTLSDLRTAAAILENVKLVTGDFEETVATATRGDFIYLDPPYPPRSRTAFFNQYCKQGFGWEHQVRLSKLFVRLSNRGCLVMLSNAGQSKVDVLYRSFCVRRLNVVRWVGSNGDRSRVREIVVTNYVAEELRH